MDTNEPWHTWQRNQGFARAANEGRAEDVFAQISECAENDTQQQSLKDLALRHAAEHGQTELVKALLAHGANIATTDENPRRRPRTRYRPPRLPDEEECPPTAVHLAARNGHDECVHVFLEHQQRLPVRPWFYRKGYWVTALQEAAAHGRVSTVKLMLDRGLAVDLSSRCASCIVYPRPRGCDVCRAWTAIKAAAEYGQAEVVDLLITRGARPCKWWRRWRWGSRKSTPKSALHLATGRGHEEIVRQLLRRGWDANDGDGYTTPLVDAATGQHEGIFNLLLENGAKVGKCEGGHIEGLVMTRNTKGLALLLPHLQVQDLDTRRDRYSNLFETAATYATAEGLDLLLGYAAKHGMSEVEDLRYGSVFSRGCDRRDDEDVVGVLIKHCLSGHATRESKIVYFIWEKAQHGHLNAVLALIEWHYEIKRDPCLLSTGLMAAIRVGRANVVKGLAELGVDVNAEVEKVPSWVLKNIARSAWSIPLHVAAQNGHVEICRILIAHGADVKRRDGSGKTALHEATASGSLETAKLLVLSGGDIHERSNDGSTPLHSAATNHKAAEVAEFLLKYGAGIEARDSNGRTPAHIAARSAFNPYHESHTYLKLQQLGADLAAIDGDGLTAAQYKEEMDQKRAQERWRDEHREYP
ncbi:ankyrin repeat-containing domain protein [Aspergillus pseudoustus]|uniref:Ankyrin repeat-containing domain protein n=1 Tax=Aspergillus pseudoustus TaxID=1810923 RepID=A0ABR4JA37_9EURO